MIKTISFYAAAAVGLYLLYLAFFAGGAIFGNGNSPDHTPTANAHSDRADKFFVKCAGVGFSEQQCRFFRYGANAQ